MGCHSPSSTRRIDSGEMGTDWYKDAKNMVKWGQHMANETSRRAKTLAEQMTCSVKWSLVKLVVFLMS